MCRVLNKDKFLLLRCLQIQKMTFWQRLEKDLKRQTLEGYVPLREKREIKIKLFVLGCSW